MRKKLLLNWVYYRPIGHVLESLKLTKGYFLANKNLDIYLLLNSESPKELADACPWIKKTYMVSLKEVLQDGEKAKCLKKIPKKWDYISTDKRAMRFVKGGDTEELIKTQKVLNKIFVVKISKGYVEQGGGHDNSILPIFTNPKVTLPIPSKAKVFSKKFKHKGPMICIMLGGSAGDKRSPSVTIWLKICLALHKSIPNLKIYFTGVSKSIDGRTSTKAFSLDDVNYLINKLPNAESVYDVGLWKQIAFISKCDIFLSPHTGFAFLATIVGTPWLEIGACPWPAYFFNDIPFYSVLPSCDSYPSVGKSEDGCGKLLSQNKKALCVSDEFLEKKIPEIIRGAKLLLDKNFTYDKAIKLHLRKIKKSYDIKRFFFFGGISGITHKNEKI